MFIAWSVAAGSPRTAAPGIRRGGTSWSPSRLSPSWCAASSGRCCSESVPISSSPTRCGAQHWILHVTAWGNGEQAVLDYLARYVFRIALTNARIVGLDDQTVSIQYKERKTGRPRTCRLSGDEFMRRFLQHVLPRGFHKVRYFGLWHPAQRHNAARVRQMLQLQAPPKLDPPQDLAAPPLVPAQRGTSAVDRAADLSALSPGAADLHPHAHAAAGHGTMIRSTRHRRPPVLLPRAPARHGDRLSPPQPTACTLIPMTPPTISETPRQTVMAHPSAAVRVSSGRDHQPGHRASWVKSPYRPSQSPTPAFVQRSFCVGFAPQKLLIRFQAD